MNMKYCKIQSNEDNPENYHFVAYNSDKWELCEIVGSLRKKEPNMVENRKNKLEKELDEFKKFYSTTSSFSNHKSISLFAFSGESEQ